MKNVYQDITDNIINSLNNGQIPWTKPWICNSKIISHATGKQYSLLNSILLEKPGEYVTYLQAQQEGGHIKKGAKSKQIYFWKQLRVKKDQLLDDGSVAETEKIIPYLKAYNVFHLSDTEGLKPRLAESENPTFENNSVVEAERIIKDYLTRECITLQHDKIDSSYYSPSRDLIQVPPLESFKNSNGYYGTMFHELGHSTGAKNRLNRFGIVSPTAIFGSCDYSKEELIAEMISAFMLANLGIDNANSKNQNAAYIQSWIKSLKNDPKMVVMAAGKAEKAVQFILGQSATP